MRNGKLKLFSVVMAAAFTINSVAAYAGNLTDLKNQYESNQQQIKTAKDALNDTEEQMSQTMREITELDAALDEATQEYNTTVENLERIIVLLAETQVELAEAEAKRQEQYEAYKNRVRYLQENGEVGYFDILLKSSSFADFLNNIEYINRIVEYDNKLVDELLATENEISEKLALIEVKKLEETILEAQQKLKKENLESVHATKLAYFEKLEYDEQLSEQMIKDLESDSARVEKLIKEAEAAAAKKAAEEEAARKAAATAAANAAAAAAAAAANASAFNGVFVWPVPSSTRVTSGYGYRPSPFGGKQEYHTGVDIGASYGANVVAAASGTVISAGWMGGYGNTVVISHGNNVSTLYGHNSSLNVKVGDVVKAGTVIAKIGSTGQSTGNHLHFEVRVSGVHTSPKNYLNY